MKQIRVGLGFDIHRFEKKRKLYLGGVLIVHSRGLAGHSDADVVLHALCDAFLGAMGKPDIGQHFPDTDPMFKDKASVYFLEKVKSMLANGRWRPVNIDCVIIADAPKINVHRERIKKNIARVLEVDTSSIAVKAKTTEGILSYSGKGIAAYCVVLIERQGGQFAQ